MDDLPVSVIIPAMNAARTIEDCLDSVRESNPAEIIVVDGNSTDRTVEIARKYTDRIYSDGGRGPSYAHQLGAEQATQPHIAYVDADTVLPQGTLAQLLAELKASDNVSMTATMVAANMSTYCERVTDWNSRLRQTRRGGGLFATVLKRETVLKYPFDAAIKPVGDDKDFLMRVEREGYKAGTSSALVYHRHLADLRSLFKSRLTYGRGSARFIRKYGPWDISFWPPLTTLYWISLCLIKGKPQFIPYFVVDGTGQTAGFVKGLFELAREALKRPGD